MNTTKKAINAIKLAFQKGYRVANNGDIVSPKGCKIKGCIKIRRGLPYRTFGITSKATLHNIIHNR